VGRGGWSSEWGVGGQTRLLVEELLNDECRGFLDWGVIKDGYYGNQRGNGGSGVYQRVRVWIKGGMEDTGLVSVTMGSMADLEGDLVRCFFRGKVEVRTSRNCLLEMVVSFGMAENGI